MAEIVWKRVGVDLFIEEPNQHDNLRHPSGEELDLLIGRWNTPPLVTVPDRMRMDNLRTWLEHEAAELGTEEQQARWRAGLLPLVELEKLARDHLFGFVDAAARREGIRRWRPLRHTDVVHGGCNGRVHITTLAVAETTSASELQHLAHLKNACDASSLEHWVRKSSRAPSIGLVEHHATCGLCGVTVGSRSALVSMPWGDRTFTREYAL